MPLVRNLGKALADRPNDAKSLARRRFHDHPGSNLANPRSTQRLEPCGFSLDVIGFNVDVDSTFVTDLLYLDNQFVIRRLKLDVRALAYIGRLFLRIPKRRCPEIGRLVEIGAVTVDDKSCQAAAVHCVILPRRQDA